MKIDSGIIEEYSVTDKVLKTTFGEVFTANELVCEMLDKLPKSVWANEKFKWLDPAAGVGNFHAVVFDRLMKGLKTVIKNEKQRRKHILENMLYFVELQKKNIDLINRIFNPHNDLVLNIFHGDFCSISVFDFEATYFDIVLGNPPYQDMHSEFKRKAKNHNLWSVFLEKGFSMLKKDGFLLFVTPPAWMSPSSKLLSSIFMKYQLHFVNLGECSRHFRGVGSQFSYYLIQNRKRYKSTRFKFEFKGGSFINSTSGESQFHLSSTIKFIPQIPSAETFKIFEKTVFSACPKFDVQYDSDLHRFTKRDLLSGSFDPEHRFKVLHTPTQVVWSKRPHKNQEKIKVFIPLTTYFESIIIEECGNTQGLGYIIVQDRAQAEHIRSILLSNLFRFIANVTRWSNFNVPLVMKSLPFFPYDIEPTNDNIYRYFGLTDIEVKFIEVCLKPNKLRYE